MLKTFGACGIIKLNYDALCGFVAFDHDLGNGVEHVINRAQRENQGDPDKKEKCNSYRDGGDV